MNPIRAVLLAIAATCAAATLLAAVFTAARPVPSPAVVAVAPSSVRLPGEVSPLRPVLVSIERHLARAELANSGRAMPAGRVEAQPELALQGWLDGIVPGYGEAWVVEAYRLSSNRRAVVERLRVYVEPDGRLTLTGLGPGLWQTALVAPRFAWGPLVDTSSPPAALRMAVGETGRLCIDITADVALPRDTLLCVSLTAVRSPALEGTAVCVQRPLTNREVVMGETWTLDDVAAGTYEVCAVLADARHERGRRPFSPPVHVVVRPGTTHVELAVADRPVTGGASATSKTGALR